VIKIGHAAVKSAIGRFGIAKALPKFVGEINQQSKSKTIVK
jgi:hypothetical protein